MRRGCNGGMDHQSGFVFGRHSIGAAQIINIECCRSTPDDVVRGPQVVISFLGFRKLCKRDIGFAHNVKHLTGHKVTTKSCTHQNGFTHQSQCPFTEMAFAHLPKTGNEYRFHQCDPVFVLFQILATVKFLPLRWDISRFSHLTQHKHTKRPIFHPFRIFADFINGYVIFLRNHLEVFARLCGIKNGIRRNRLS